jgi:hypothetical protein
LGIVYNLCLNKSVDNLIWIKGWIRQIPWHSLPWWLKNRTCAALIQCRLDTSQTNEVVTKTAVYPFFFLYSFIWPNKMAIMFDWQPVCNALTKAYHSLATLLSCISSLPICPWLTFTNSKLPVMLLICYQL